MSVDGRHSGFVRCGVWGTSFFVLIGIEKVAMIRRRVYVLHLSHIMLSGGQSTTVGRLGFARRAIALDELSEIIRDPCVEYMENLLAHTVSIEKIST